MSISSFSNRRKPFTLPELGEVRLWKIDLQGIRDDEIEEAKKYITEERLARCLRYVFEDDRRRAIMTHANVGIVLGELTGVEPNKLNLQREEKGKPYLADRPLEFNFSDTKMLSTLGVHSSRRIGVDVEIIRKVESMESVADQFMNATEKEWAMTQSDKATGFFSIWCAKEAYLKAIGTGLLVKEMPSLNVRHHQEAMTIFEHDGNLIHVFKKLIPQHFLAVSTL